MWMIVQQAFRNMASDVTHWQVAAGLTAHQISRYFDEIAVVLCLLTLLAVAQRAATTLRQIAQRKANNKYWNRTLKSVTYRAKGEKQTLAP